jgi:hypothetical protein
MLITSLDGLGIRTPTYATTPTRNRNPLTLGKSRRSRAEYPRPRHFLIIAQVLAIVEL